MNSIEIDTTPFQIAQAQAILGLAERTHFLVNVDRLDALVKVFNKIARRIARTGGEEVAPRLIVHNVGRNVTDENDPSRILYVQTVVEIQGSPLTNRGWTIAGMINHMPEGNLLNGFGDASLMQYADAHADCDHCNQNRRRLITFIVERDGERKQIGSTCLLDYCAIDPRHAASILDWAKDATNPEANEKVGRSGSSVLIEDLVKAADLMIRKWGYKKSADANSTKEAVMDYLFARDMYGDQIRAAVKDMPKCSDERAEAILNYWQSIIGTDDFTHTMSVVASMHTVGRKEIGRACYLAEGYRRHEQDTERARLMAAKVASENVAVGQPIKVSVVVSAHTERWGYKGCAASTIDFLTSNGTKIRWWASSKKSGFTPGETMTITGKVTKVNEYGITVNYVEQI